MMEKSQQMDGTFNAKDPVPSMNQLSRAVKILESGKDLKSTGDQMMIGAF